MADDLPENFVPRPAELDALIADLLDEDREEPVAITAALRGAGGYGKTTLARAICHDERIQDAYHDGVLWVTLGEDRGDLGGRVTDLIHVLTGQRQAFATQDAAVSRLREALDDRRLLIVIDDLHSRVVLGQPLDQAIAYVNKALDRKGLTAFDAREPEERHQAVAATLEMSFEHLTGHERERFEALAIFPEDVILSGDHAAGR